jgi:hypothetical protein
MWMRCFRVVAACGALLDMIFAQGVPRPPASLAGEWRSEPRISARPDVQVTLAVEPALTARMVLRGETKNVSEWATLRAERMAWDGRRLTFTTVLPHDEGTAYWALVPTGQAEARLTAVPDDAEPGDDMPGWTLKRIPD